MHNTILDKNMRSKECNAAVVLVLVAVFSGCGGGGGAMPEIPVTTSATIGGTVNGITPGRSLFVRNNTNIDETLRLTADGDFVFATKVAGGSSYDVGLAVVPTGLICSLKNNAGSVAQGVVSVTGVTITCQEGAIGLPSYVLGVTVSGLLPNRSLLLSNNGQDLLTVRRDGLAIFPHFYSQNIVYNGKAGGYDVNVTANPTGQTCTIAGPSGANPFVSVDYVQLVVTCK